MYNSYFVVVNTNVIIVLQEISKELLQLYKSDFD